MVVSSRVFVLAAFAIAAVGCRPTADAGEENLAACADRPSRTVSEECCPDFGIDACGAGLFCAALDGREVPTCFVERSRQSGETCSEDRSCVNGGCQAGRCQSTRGEICSVEVGCANPLNDGRVYVCSALSLVCIEGGFATGDGCGEDVVCASGECFNDTCIEADDAAKIGEACVDSEDCGSGFSCAEFSGSSYCTIFCDDDGSCPGTSVCGRPLLNDVCFKSCSADGDCGRTGYGCLEGRCVPWE